MIVFLCIDDQGGIRFHHRRQSQDRAVRYDILCEAAGQILWMNTDTYRQFRAVKEVKIRVDEMFLRKAKQGQFCFVEDQELLPIVAEIEKVILYRWNRRYPADQYLDLPLQNWNCIGKSEFSGYSHDKITKEIYMK